MSGTRSPGTARRAPGRRAQSLERTRRGSCQEGTRSVGVSGGKASQRESGTVDSVANLVARRYWRIGIRPTRRQISWEILQLKIDSFNIGEKVCLLERLIDQMDSTLNNEHF